MDKCTDNSYFQQVSTNWEMKLLAEVSSKQVTFVTALYKAFRVSIIEVLGIHVFI